MDISKKIKMAATYAGLKDSDVARAIETSPQNFSQRQKVAKWTDEERAKIAEAIGAKYVYYFEFPDGTKI